MSLSAFSSAFGPTAYKSRQVDFFDLSPVPLWLEDWSDVRALLTSWKPADGAAVHALLLSERERVAACARLIRVVRVNKAALELYDAKDEMDLIEHAEKTSVGGFPGLAEDLSQLWDARVCASMTVKSTLTGREIFVSTKSKIMPGHENDWRQVLVSTEDVTALRGAYLGH